MASEIATNQTLQKAIKPLQSAAHAGATAAVEAMQTGLIAAQSITSALQPAAGTAVAEVFAQYGRELPKKITNWKHLFFAELRGSAEEGILRSVGFHAPRAKNTGVTILKIYPPDGYGSSVIIFEYKGCVKYSTVFAETIDHKTLIKTIKQAYRNPVECSKDGWGFLGKTPKGQKIQFWFRKQKQTGKMILDSIYPELPITEQIKKDLKIFKGQFHVN